MDIFYTYPEEYPKELAACGIRQLMFHTSSMKHKGLDINTFLTTYFPYEVEALVFGSKEIASWPDGKLYSTFEYYADTGDLDKSLNPNVPEHRKKLFIHNFPRGRANMKAQEAFIQYCVRRGHEAGYKVIAVDVGSMSMAMDNALDGVIVHPHIDADRGDVFLLNGSRFYCHGAGCDSDEEKRRAHNDYARKFLREVGYRPEELIEEKAPFSKRKMASIKAWEFAKENWTKTRHLRVGTGSGNRSRDKLPGKDRVAQLPILLPEGQESAYGMEWDDDEKIAVLPSEDGETLVQRRQRLKEEQYRRRKEILAQRAEGVVCDYCVIFAKCEQARPGHICAKPNGFSALAKEFATTNAQQLVKAIGVVLVQLAERNQAAMELERREGMILKDVTDQQKALFDMGMRLAKMLDPKLGAADAKNLTLNVTNNVRIQAAQYIKELFAGGEVTPGIVAQAIRKLREDQEQLVLSPALPPASQQESVVEAEFEDRGGTKGGATNGS